MIDMQNTVTVMGDKGNIPAPKQGIMLYTAPGVSPARIAMDVPSDERGTVTSDGGRLVGWFGPQDRTRPTTLPAEAWMEEAHFVAAYREMTERIAAINASLQRLQEHLAAEEHSHTGTNTTVVSPHLSALAWIKDATGFSDSRVAALVGVTRQTLDRWRGGKPIANDKRRRVLAVRDVLERALRRHPTIEALGAWLDTPQGSDGRTPSDLLAEGQIDKARLLAVTSPSPAVIPPPAWASASTTAATIKRDTHQQAIPPWYDSDIDGDDEDKEVDVFVPLELDQA